MSIERTNPLTGSETQRRWLQNNAAIIEAAEEGASVGAQEIHTSVDGAGLERVFRCHKNIGRTYHLGSVANEAAMLALDSPFASHACLPGDTCFRIDTQQTMRCISNYGASLSDWEVVPTDVQKTAGVVVRPTITRNGDGTVTVGSDGIYALYTDDTPSVIGRFSCEGGTFALTEGATHYLLARYSGGSASLLWTTDRSQVEGNFRTVIPIETLYLFGGEIHGDSWDEAGHALAEKMLNRLINTSRYVRDEIDGGLALGELTGRIVTISSGSVWRGVEKTQLAAFNSSSGGRLLLHVWNGTSWTVSTVTQYNNTSYQGESGLVSLQNSNRYAINWLFRTGGDDVDCVLVLGTGDYTLDQALASGIPANLPALATRHGFLVGRIIVAKDGASAYRIESAFVTGFQSGLVSDHNALSNLQGGAAGNYYHFNQLEHDALAGVSGAPRFLRASVGVDITSDTQVSLHLAKGIRMDPIDTGPFFGSGFGVHAYRTTNENIPEAFLWRGAGYIFEDSGANWMLTIVPEGVNIGSPASFDLTEIPKSKLEVANNVSIGELYARKVAAPANGLLVQGQVLLGKPTPVATKTSTKLEVGGEARFEARLDAVGGVSGAPAVSGSTSNHSFRVGAESYTTLAMDMGVYASGLGFWLQARSSSDFSALYPVRINPNGGEVQIGVATYITDDGIKTGAPSGQSVANWKFGAVSNGYAHVSINGSNYKIAVTPE